MKRVMIGLLSLALLVSFVLTPKISQAEDQPVEAPPEVGVEVNHIARGFEKVAEKISLFSKFSKEKKADYQIYLAKKRLAEMKYVIDTGDVNSIEETASRYTTYLGRASEYVIKHQVKSKKEELLKMYSEHGKIIEDLQKDFEFESGWWLAIQHGINVNKLFSDQIQSL